MKVVPLSEHMWYGLSRRDTNCLIAAMNPWTDLTPIPSVVPWLKNIQIGKYNI